MNAIVPAIDHAAIPPGAIEWSLPRRLLFRFGFVYWLLFCSELGTQIDGIDWFFEKIHFLWTEPAVWLGHHVLGIEGPINTTTNGSGDRTIDYLLLFLYASVALLATIVWSILARHRREHERLRAALRVVMRYTLAFVLLSYGVVKLFGGQFPPPGSGRLMQRYGDSSPMGLLWTFMGASKPYVMFSGAAETLGALLLLFRRTTTLGALVLGAVLTNVVLMNFCYDVPVKINSSHYLVMCGILALPDLRRLANVLVLNRTAEPAPSAPAPRRRWVRITRLVVKYGVIVVLGGLLVKDTHESVTGYLSGPKTWYDGYWKVQRFERNGQDLPPLVTDATRWQRIKFETGSDKSYVRWRTMDESIGELYTVVVDDQARTMTWTLADDSKPKEKLALTFARPDADHLVLSGTIGKDQVAVTFERWNADRMLLVTRGFHWINERPFNR